MDGKTIEQVRTLLLGRWEKIGGNGKQQLPQATEAPEDIGAEIIDIAQSLEQLDRDKSLKEQERRELQAIERALAKLSSGSFGICEDCGEEIPSKRLMVLPEARLCAHCQAFEERQNARIRSPGAAAR